MAKLLLPSAALERRPGVQTPCEEEDSEADDDAFSCKSWDRTRTPDASTEVIGGQFELVQRIGRGGVASMHQGKCLRTGRLVAIKTIFEESTVDRKAALSEAAVLRALDHSQINRLVTVVEDEFNIYLVLEYSPGMDLMEMLLQSGPMEEESAANIIQQMVEVLAYCHSHGIVHRDVKPENIMLCGDEIMLVDFGLAAEVGKVLEEGEDEGTPIYLAPEARCGPVSCDGSLDMFSLGVALFAMLSGRLPTHRASPALSSESLLPDVSPGARDFLAQLLAEPAQRLSASQAREHPWLVSCGCRI